MDASANILAVFAHREWFNREVMRGVFDYRQERTRWRVVCRDYEALQDTTGFSGVIGFIYLPEHLQALRASGLPAVDYADWLDSTAYSRVVPDSRAIGRVAAEHALSRDYRWFAYVGSGICRWDRHRHDGWAKRLRREPGVRMVGAANPNEGEAALRDWLVELPKPVAVMGANDVVARRVLEACEALDLTVPEEVGVIGVDDDELVCESTTPRLTSVARDCYRIGWGVAEELDRRLRDPASRPGVRRVSPTGLVERSSTAPRVSDDRVVAKAVGYIRDHIAQPINAAQVASRVKVSQRTLETRMRRAIGVSPHQFIQDTRLQRARWLLEHTNLPIGRVAARCGFQDQRYFSSRFRLHTGRTPRAYRAQPQSTGRGDDVG